MTTTAMNILSGYGINIRSLQERDLTENKISPSDFVSGPAVQLGNCVAVEGEDMARALAAIVDVAHNRVVWSSRPVEGDYQEPHPANFRPLNEEEAEAVAQAVCNLVRFLLPEVGL